MAGPGICVQWEHFDPAGRRTTVLLEAASTLTWKSGTSNMRVLLEIGGGSCFLDDHTTARYNASALVHSILLECRGPHATRNHVTKIIRLRSRFSSSRRSSSVLLLTNGSKYQQICLDSSYVAFPTAHHGALETIPRSRLVERTS